MIAHARALLFAFPTWCIALLWLWPRAVQAEALAKEVRGYDWPSLGYAAALGLLGGCLALIYALATDRRVVVEVLKEAGRNALVSPLAGLVAYMLLKALAALDWLTLSTEPRFVVIVGAGWAAIAFIEWVRAMAAKGATNVGGWLLTRGEKP